MTGPVTTEALVDQIARILDPEAHHLGLPDYYGPEPILVGASARVRVARKNAGAILAGPLAPFLAAHQQVTAERDEGTEETVSVPASALRWLFGEGPDADGRWFGDWQEGDPELKGAFWWRSEFRRRIEALAAHPADPEAQGLAKIIAAKCKEVDAVLGPDPWKTRKHVGGIYIASKTAHAPRWRQMRADGLPIISTWIDEAGKGETACFNDLWQRCVDEASSADAVIVYREPGEVLKGAFVEVGAALAVGAPVYAIGCDEFSFVHHGGVTRCADLRQALDLAAPPASSGQGGR